MCWQQFLHSMSIHFQQTKLIFEQSENSIKTVQTKLNFEHLNFNWRSLTRSIIVNIKVPFNFPVKEISKQFKCRQDCCFQLYTTIFSYRLTSPAEPTIEFAHISTIVYRKAVEDVFLLKTKSN